MPSDGDEAFTGASNDIKQSSSSCASHAFFLTLSEASHTDERWKPRASRRRHRLAAVPLRFFPSHVLRNVTDASFDVTAGAHEPHIGEPDDRTNTSQRGSCIRGASRDTAAAGFARRERGKERERKKERERELCPWAPSLRPPVVDSPAAPPRSGASGVSAEVRRGHTRWSRRTWSRGSLLVLRPSFLPPTTRTCFICISLLLLPNHHHHQRHLSASSAARLSVPRAALPPPMASGYQHRLFACRLFACRLFAAAAAAAAHTFAATK
ncbi:hypothetical protein EYF80_062523 [Liparis tanakae]|uniref:Uncharacterized protein n=1 Tax=Liparis tanakae TaxID=230148 RepID=A0A4Z2EF12_9TELE|nr:hypothetical protein EYF80_062523 [Liparis tanakae]